MLILFSILLTKPTYLTTVFTQFLTMLIMNLLHLVVMQKFLFVSAYLTLPVSDVLTTLLHLNPSKNPGPDGISSLLLKNLAPQISSSITYIFNKTLNDGIFPSKWKDCNRTPVFKSYKKDIVSNYRGIALLPILSKVLERQVHTRLYQHVSGFLYSQQHEFRKRR